MITLDRLNEMQVVYDEMKLRIIDIDNKYDINFHEPQLNMPETLGLEKRVFKEKTSAQLQADAKRIVAPMSTAKRSQIDVKQENALKTISQKRAALSEKLRKSIAASLESYNRKADELYLKLINNGLLFSTIKEKLQKEALDAYNAKVEELNCANENENAILDELLKATGQSHKKQVEALEKEMQQKEIYYFQKLINEYEKERAAVEKYNAQIDEKEVKYQAYRERAYESARHAEYDRVYKMARLYAQLGETGLNQRKINEKMSVAKQYFLQFTKEEANIMLSRDSFLRTHLQTYYNTFTSWVDATLR